MADPVVLASVMTYNGADTVTTRIDNLDLSGFDLAMDEQESKADGHVTETLGWIAIQSGTGTTAEGRKLEVFFEQLDHVLTPVVYTTGHRHPTVLGDVDSTYEADPVSLRYASPTNAKIELMLDRGNISRRRDRSHAGGRGDICRRVDRGIWNGHGLRARFFTPKVCYVNPTGLPFAEYEGRLMAVM